TNHKYIGDLRCMHVQIGKHFSADSTFNGCLRNIFIIFTIMHFLWHTKASFINWIPPYCYPFLKVYKKTACPSKEQARFPLFYNLYFANRSSVNFKYFK